MSLFGSLMGDFDDDIFGNHMNAMNMQMRSMNRLMNTFMPDPFNMLTNFDPGFQQNALMERQNPHQMGLFGFPAMPNMNRLLSADIGNNGGAAFCSSSVITMSSGPDGRPQIYQATSSTKTGPGGIRETRRTVQDSVNGVKKMAIGHHIGERAHIIEKEQDLRSGQLEEHQEFINLEEDEAEDFDREFTTKAHGSGGRGGMRAIAAPPQQTLTIEPLDDDDDDDVIETGIQHHQRPPSSHQRRHMPTLPTPPQPPSTQTHQNSSSNLTTSTTATSSATIKSPSSATATSSLNAAANTTSLYTTSSAARPTTATTTANISNNNNNSQYISSNPRRSSAYRSNHHLTGASPRRPLRTPPSSPLATTPTLHSHGTTSTPSVHPHPYNSSAARRSHHHHHHHRSKHAKQHSASANSNNSAASAGKTSQPKEEDHQNNSN